MIGVEDLISVQLTKETECSVTPILQPHHDSATYSFVITLNTPGIDFTGGGTRFIKQKVTIQGKKGWCTIHPGKLTHYHEGLPITSGKRFIMVSFVY